VQSTWDTNKSNRSSKDGFIDKGNSRVHQMANRQKVDTHDDRFKNGSIHSRDRDSHKSTTS